MKGEELRILDTNPRAYASRLASFSILGTMRFCFFGTAKRRRTCEGCRDTRFRLSAKSRVPGVLPKTSRQSVTACVLVGVFAVKKLSILLADLHSC